MTTEKGLNQFITHNAMLERFSQYRKDYEITLIDESDSLIEQFIHTELNLCIHMFHDYPENNIRKDAFTTYLHSLITLFNNVPNFTIGDLEKRYEVEKKRSEIKKIRIEAFPLSTYYKMLTTVGLTLLTSMTAITIYFNEFIQQNYMWLLVSFIGSIGFSLIMIGLNVLRKNEAEKNELYYLEFPKTKKKNGKEPPPG